METGRFKSGHPGRLPIAEGGSPNRLPAAKKLIQDNLESLVQECINVALTGDVQALRLLISTQIPQLKSIDVKTDGGSLPTFKVINPPTIVESEAKIVSGDDESE